MIKKYCLKIITYIILVFSVSINVFATDASDNQTTVTNAINKTLVIEQASSNIDAGILLWALVFIAVFLILVYICFNVYRVKNEERKQLSNKICKPKLIIAHARLSSDKNNFDV